MKKEIKIPDIAENVDTGVIGRIIVSKGDEVKKDQPVVEVETDKAATDIPSPFDGTIDEIMVDEGDEVSVGDVIMIVEVAGEEDADKDEHAEEQDEQGADEEQEEHAAEGDQEQENKGAAGDEEDEDREVDKAEDEEGDEEGKEQDKDAEAVEDDDEDEDDEDSKGDEDEKDAKGDEDGKDAKGDEDKKKKAKEKEDAGKKAASGSGEAYGDGKGTALKRAAAEDIPAAPSVRRMAREAGVDLAEVRGSGPGNRITSEDITAAKERREAPGGEDKKEKEKKATGKPSKESAAAREGAIELPDFSQWGDTKKERMNTVRRITARTMTASWQQIPQVTQFDEADITQTEAFRQKHKDDFEKQGGKLTVTAILLKIAAFALQKFPRFNASLDTSDNTLVMKQYINIGIAVDTDKGLIVPVIRDTDKKPLAEISVETVALAEKARENEISPDELQGGNFTISNLGGIGGTGFTPIVYPPQVAILGVARATQKQVLIEGEGRFKHRLVLPLSLTYDHRVIDGADGARFLRWICDVLEDPYALLQ